MFVCVIGPIFKKSITYADFPDTYIRPNKISVLTYLK